MIIVVPSRWIANPNLSKLEVVPIPKPLSFLKPILTLIIPSQRFSPSRSHVNPISLIPTSLCHPAWIPPPLTVPHFRRNMSARWSVAESMTIVILSHIPSHRWELFFFWYYMLVYLFKWLLFYMLYSNTLITSRFLVKIN